ncbi:TPA: tetratricopeptide repeat protein, partial [Candidatus Poribacteria bacterium]|nr:tetratricopeptide repeat protein [Candidatus Poribacteria bacterium]HEX30631.1 tetratricopeptide repeat protein [Candidatus Poribacteria bacterium]
MSVKLKWREKMGVRKVLRFAILILCLSLLATSILFAFVETDKNVKIIQRYKQILYRKPKEGSVFDRLYQFYLEGPGLDRMVADYQREAEEKPNDPNIQLILGHIYKRLGRDKAAVKAYERAAKLAPDDYYPPFALGRMYITLRRYEEAIEPLKRAAALAERSGLATPQELADIYKSLGKAYYNRDRLNDAIAAWNRIAEIDPTNIFARIELADLFREQKLYQQAIAQHEAIIKLKGNDPYRVCLSLREIGKIQEEMGRYDEAIRSYDKALALTAPGNWLRKDLQQRIIRIYAHNGDWDGLIEYYKAKLKERPNEVELIGLLGDAYVENEKVEEGIAQYRKGLKLAPTSVELRLKLISALRDLKRFEEAAAEYEKLIEAQPDEIGHYRELGEIYMRMGLPDKAREVYKRMIERQPDDPGAHLTLAEIYAKHEWIEDAIAEYERAIQ